MMRETGSQLAQQAVSGQKERYPVLGNTLRQVPYEEQLPISRYSATYKIPRKEASSPNLGKFSSKETAAGNTHIEDPFKDGVYDSGPGMLLRNHSFLFIHLSVWVVRQFFESGENAPSPSMLQRLVLQLQCMS